MRHPAPTARPLRVLLAATLGCVLVSGCVSLGGKAPKALLDLTAETTAPAGSTASGQLADALVVLDPEADRSLDVTRVPVRVDASTIAYVKDVTWMSRPASQFRNLLAETLRARTGRLVVEGGDFEVTGRTLVGGRLIDMGYDVAAGAVVVRFDAVVSERRQGLKSRRFEASVPMGKPKAGNIGPALNTAANDVARQIADWLAPTPQ